MSLKQTVPTNGGDYVQFGNATTPVAAQVGGYEDSTGNGHLEWYTTASGTVTERMRITSAGAVGIGVTPLTSLGGYSSLDVGAVGNGILSGTNDYYVTSNAYYNATWKYGSNNAASYYRQIDGQHIWNYAVAGTAGNTITWIERMRIDASGNVLINTTSQISSGKACLAYAGNANQGLVFNDTSSNATAQPLRFLSGGTLVGYIQTSTSATTYITSSDYRLKENIVPMVGALEKVALLKPVTYKWKIDGSDGQGFIAHELQEVIPDCVVGTKDALDKDGNPEYQGIDTSFLVATLTAAIQELSAKVNALEEQVINLGVK